MSCNRGFGLTDTSGRNVLVLFVLFLSLAHDVLLKDLKIKIIES